MISPEDASRELAAATGQLLGDLEGLSDAQVAGPSLLPGWTRGHVLSHLARNAEGGTRLLGWARTGVPSYEYESLQARAAAIEAGADDPFARDLVPCPLNKPISATATERRHLMTEPTPRIDFANLPAPEQGFLVTLFITVRKVARSRDFYSRVLGGTVVLEENPCMVKLANSWIIMNPGGPPTPDKPGITVADYQPGNTTSIFLNLRVADIQACYQEWKAKGAEFVTPPIDRGAEIRCYIRDPDGYLIEVGQSTGLLHGKLAAKRPEDLQG